MFSNPKHRKKLQAVWATLCVVIVLSMLLFSVSSLLR